MKELNRNDTKMLQGLCAVAMVCLHLFNRSHEGLFQPLLFLGGIPLSFYISLLCDFCVMGFAFCSGYAHMALYDNTTDYYKNRVKSLKRLLTNYWVIVIIFSMISILIGKAELMPGNFKKFVLNILLLDQYYNGSWWYMLVYVVLIAISPVILKAVQKSVKYSMIIGVIIYCIAYYVRFRVSSDSWCVIKFGPFGMTLFEYLIGAIAYKIQFFTELYKYWKRIPRVYYKPISLIVFIVMLLGRVMIIPSLFFAPFTGIVIITLFHFWEKPRSVERLFMFLGKHSTNIWLVHMFFYATLFYNFVYIVRYPILIFIMMMITTLLTSGIIQKIQKLFLKEHC